MSIKTLFLQCLAQTPLNASLRHLFFTLIFLPSAPVAAAATVSSDEDIFQNAIPNLF